jgi:hypothetical protein
LAKGVAVGLLVFLGIEALFETPGRGILEGTAILEAGTGGFSEDEVERDNGAGGGAVGFLEASVEDLDKLSLP